MKTYQTPPFKKKLKDNTERCHHTVVLHHVDVEHLHGINKYLRHQVVFLYHFDIKHIMKQHDQKCGILNMLLKYLKAEKEGRNKKHKYDFLTNEGMEADRSHRYDAKVTEDKSTAENSDDENWRELLLTDFGDADESNGPQQHVGDVCVFAARFHSGVEVGYRQLPPLTKFVWVEGHMPSLFSGLRAALANGSSNRKK